MAYTNCTEAELLLNGEGLGKKAVDRYDMCEWSVEFVPGELTAVGYIDGREVCRDSVKTAGRAVRLVLKPHKDTLYRSCGDAAAINVSAEDADGNFVPLAQNHVRFICEGGKIIGVGNGDPNSHESDKMPERNLFNGRCQVIVEPLDDAGCVTVTAHADGTEGGTSVTIPVMCGRERRYIASINEKYLSVWRTNVELFDKKPDPFTVIEDHDMNNWTIVRVGGGYDERFDGKVGYALYRAKTVLADADKRIEFRDLEGEYFEIYINGENVFGGEIPWKKNVSFTLPKKREIEVNVIIRTSAPDARGGISAPVVIL